MSVVTTKDLRKNYEAEGAPVRALRGVDVEIKEGEFVAVMGPSGCGKSTLLNLIGALDRPSGGEIEMAGLRVDQLSETAAARFRRANVGFVFQLFHLLDDLTVAENVEVPALMAGRSRAEARDRAGELLRQLGLADRARAFPSRLSGGERQRLAIARAVVNQPAVLLADEPTGALDRANGDHALALLEDLNRRGQTIVLVTHDEALARQRAHRIVRLVDGTIQQDQPNLEAA